MCVRRGAAADSTTVLASAGRSKEPITWPRTRRTATRWVEGRQALSLHIAATQAQLDDDGRIARLTGFFDNDTERPVSQ